MGEQLCRLFIVEHDRETLDSMVFLLGEADVLGCEVKGALAGEQGILQGIKEFAPDMVIGGPHSGGNEPKLALVRYSAR